MSPARRTALTSVVAAAVLIAVKLAAGLATNSLGFLSEAAHSGTDLAAALLTFFAIGVASRPADSTHTFGHGKAEHLSALAECAVLAAVSVILAVAAVRRLLADTPSHVETTWWAFGVIAVVIVLDLTRMVISQRSARRYESAALAANALHFASDLAGTIAVLIGLILTRSGVPSADAFAALFVAGLVLVAAVRMARVNIDVLMDHTPLAASARARDAIEQLGPEISLRRLRMREAAGRHFADVVIAVPPAVALAEGHLAADAVEAAIQRELPDADVVVRVEPGSLDDTDIRERVLAAALTVPGVREIHNVRVFQLDAHTHVALHLKLPSSSNVASAHAVASAVEGSILASCPTVAHVTTHLEPLEDPVSDAAQVASQEDLAGRIEAAVIELTGRRPQALRMTLTPDGVIVFLDIGMDGDTPLAAAHVQSGVIRKHLRDQIDDLTDVVVHTEPVISTGGGHTVQITPPEPDPTSR